MVTRTNFKGDQFPENNKVYYIWKENSKEQEFWLKFLEKNLKAFFV